MYHSADSCAEIGSDNALPTSKGSALKYLKDPVYA